MDGGYRDLGERTETGPTWRVKRGIRFQDQHP